ncbi:hypothetical protein P691DRAFT_794299 [Macrolepiota fuliginosa MF-IS2]|uniref:WSC domain-containing protein n=1 Tax=Macrolepiota fuliginosa MF-IS2 TaxID=1400762 RepID=A0A9P5XA74_9AGAR|nr:hypothetical protein P691DRAFT_794299 [Macrolepiota fuliginosa MF-IS2]
MTIEICMNFCNPKGYIFAGVEFGHCDSTIQIPGEQAADTDCNVACSGNATELCGGSNRLNIFTNGKPSPQIVQEIDNGTWVYQGCYTDSVSARTLINPVNIPLGVTASTCVAACQSLSYAFAGIETGRECCMCMILTRVSDNDCRQICDADVAQYCGNGNRLAIYHFSSAPGGPTECVSTEEDQPFTLQAQFKNPPTSGPSTVNLKPVVVEMVKDVVWTVLAACTTCCSEWPKFLMKNAIVLPQSDNIIGQLMASTAPGDGESPNFVASVPAFPGVQAYCTMDDISAPAGSPSLLAFGGKADAFSLCTNLTANNRLDLVYSPVTGHPHYISTDCQPVLVQMIQV